MGGAASMLQARAQSTVREMLIDKRLGKNREQEKNTHKNQVSTSPLSKCIDREQWLMVSSILTFDPTALYTPSSDGVTLPLQNAIRKKAPAKVLCKLVRACANIQIPRPSEEPDNGDDDDDEEKTENKVAYIQTTGILPTIDTDPITFQHGRHKVGLLQLIMTMVNTESLALKLVDIVLEVRRKEEIKRISIIDGKNSKVTKRNKKIKKKKKRKPLLDTTPRNPLLSEISAHNNTPLHVAVIRSFAPEFQQRLIDVDIHGFDLSLSDESRFSCAALTKSSKGRLPLHIACRGPFHGPLKVLRPFTIMEQLVKHAPGAARVPTKLGARLPLHLVLRGRANKSIVQLVLDSYPDAASVPTANGNYPLHIAIWNRAAPSVIRLILSKYPMAARVRSPSSQMYPIDLALERHMDEKIVRDILRATLAGGPNSCCAVASKHRLTRLMPKLWRHDEKSTWIQSTLRRNIQQAKYAALKQAVMLIQPWCRGCLERKKNTLRRRALAVQALQGFVRTCAAIWQQKQRAWAVEEIHHWLMDYTWIQTFVENRVLRTKVVVPDTAVDMMEEVYQKIAERRNAGDTIVRLLRAGFLSAKDQHGYVRAVNQVNLRHRSITLINRTVNSWVKFVKMHRAWTGLLALQCVRTWLRQTTQLKRVQDLHLRRDVAASRFQATGRGYVQRRNAREHQHAIVIQSWFRCLTVWRKYRVMKFSAIRIEKMRRAAVAKHKYWWVATPGGTKSRKFEKQAVKVAYAQREGFHSDPPENHTILGFNEHLFPTKKDRHEHSRLKLRMFLPTR
jgi:hypothetical protein